MGRKQISEAVESSHQGPHKGVLRLLIGVLALWPLLCGALVLSLEDPLAPGIEYFVYRSLGHVAIVLTLIICALSSARQRRYRKATLTRLDVLLIALVTWAFVYTTLFAQPNYYLLVPAAVIHLLTLLGVISAISLFARWSDGVPPSIWTAIFVSMLLYLPLLPYIVFVASEAPDFIWKAAFAPVQNVRWYGALLAIALAAGLAPAWPRPLGLSPSRWWRPVGLIILWALLFWSGSRGQVLGLFGAVAIVVLLNPRLRPRLAFQTTATAVPGLALSALPPTPTADFGFLSRLLGRTFEADLNAASSGRIQLWLKTVEVIQEKPLFGHGLLQFFPVVLGEDNAASAFHSHNFPLEAMLAFGLIGGGALIFLVLRFYVRQMTRAHQRDFPEAIVPPVLIFTTILLMSLVSGGVLFQTISAYLVIAGCAIWAGLAPLNRERQTEKVQ
ncbi:hypothetical protein GV827_20230 [Sulfitobacter sp. JBTF-M27]|uniref:O-antigen ligase-related domain-containing protein n=1 Tax=Sulfitobacter sediminilitoris TaxID=2698830 RepID=A0A6P0CFK8_9RHOB|nr:O-antigen ligase family protein [Sulfitobacter sediminilitoris]NEK24707.1 hypothetical protein [Sulfitobacter sediminilitoris]